MNKIECKKILKQNKFLTPKWVEFEESLEITDVSFANVKPNEQEVHLVYLMLKKPKI